MLITGMLIVCVTVFVAGVVYRAGSAAAAVKESRAWHDARPFEIDNQLIAYINRTGGRIK